MEFFLDYANSSVFTRTVLPYEMATTNASTANTTVAVEPMARNESLAVIEIAVQVTILLLAVVGNSIVVLFLFLRPKKLSRMHLLILHLSLADLFVAFCQVLPQIAWDITYRFKGGDFLCRLVKYFQGLAMFASSYVLITTAIDRYFAICHPLTSSSWGSGKIHKMVGAAWSLALLFSVPQMVIFSYMEVEPGTEIYDCWGVFDPMWKLQLYITWITVSVYIIPTILLAILYGNICYSVWKCGKTAAKLAPGYCKPPPVPKPASSHAGRNGERGLLRGMSEENVAASQGKHHHGISRAKIKTIKLTMTVIACYLICWSPFFVAQMWAAYDPNAPFYGEYVFCFFFF